jgi:hypothetical protein
MLKKPEPIILTLLRMGVVLPAAPGSKDCSNCEYKDLPIHPDIHCYMFRKEPEGNVCGQFKPKKRRNPKDEKRDLRAVQG